MKEWRKKDRQAKRLARPLCRLGLHDWRYEVVRSTRRRWGATIPYAYLVLKCTRCGKEWGRRLPALNDSPPGSSSFTGQF
jgi:hypothetical protein